MTKVRTPESSAIVDLTYDEETEELTVHIRKGPKGKNRLLVYGNVPMQTFCEFKDAESKGGFFVGRIRSVYPYLGAVEK